MVPPLIQFHRSNFLLTRLSHSGIIFVLLYCIVTFFIWLSKDIFRFVGAILFGAYLSTFFVLIAESINACILFYLARFLGRDFVENYLKTKGSKLDDKIGGLNFFWLSSFLVVMANSFLSISIISLGGFTALLWR